MVQIHAYVADLDTLRGRMPVPAPVRRPMTTDLRAAVEAGKRDQKQPFNLPLEKDPRPELQTCPVHRLPFRGTCLRCDMAREA